MKPVYLDYPSYQLGDLEKSIEQTDSEGNLISDVQQLKEAGFHKHHVCSDKFGGYEMAKRAVEKVKISMEQNDLNLKNVDIIVYATCLPINANIGSIESYNNTKDIKYLITYPASKLQAEFDMDKAFIIGIDQQACTSMLGAIRLAKNFIQSEDHINSALCLTSDRFPEDAKFEQSYNLISDGAAAVYVTDKEQGFKVLTCHQITNGAMSQASDDETVGHYFNYSNRLIKECLERSNLTISDIDYIIPQNTNKAAWEILCGLLGYSMDKVLMETLETVAHCISGDNIINLKHANDRNIFKKGDKVLMLMAGFGLNWQCVIVEKV